MSRGPGRWQRAILTAVADGPVALTHPDYTPAEQNAIRRAAYVLEKAGRIQLSSERVDGTAPRLVARAAGSAAVPGHVTIGLDGKKYRRPPLPPLDIHALLPDMAPEEIADLIAMADLPQAAFEQALRKARLDGDLSRENVLRRAGVEPKNLSG